VKCSIWWSWIHHSAGLNRILKKVKW
jgi:hypothetical protein